MNFGKLKKIIDFLNKDSAVHVSLNLLKTCHSFHFGKKSMITIFNQDT